MDCRYFWQWRTQLSLCPENILFDQEEGDELCLWHFLDHFRMTGASDLAEEQAHSSGS